MNPVSIIGGGLSGLTLGILLREQDVPVTIKEAGNYPRYRVCGEFISGRGLKVLAGLGVSDSWEAGARMMAQDTVFFLEGVPSPVVSLPEPAWCLARWTLDQALAVRFRELGGILVERCRGNIERGQPGLVEASGRRRVHGRSDWVGISFHLKELSLRGDLEMHFQEGAYVGLCEVEGGMFNVCGLIPRSRLPDRLSTDPHVALETVFSKSLNGRLGSGRLVLNSLTTVASLDYSATSVKDDGVLRIGDSRGLIPPVTGNGMSLAFEAAELASGPLVMWAKGHCSWAHALDEVRLRQTKRFGQRLFWARQLQRAMLHPFLATRPSWAMKNLPTLLPLGFRLTR